MNQSTKIWDIAVPRLLIREAGGSVSDIEGKEIIFDLSAKAINQNYTILASGRGIHEDLIDIINVK